MSFNGKTAVCKRVVASFLSQRVASMAEKEVEKLFRLLLKGTPFANKTHAVGGYVRDQYISLLKNDPSIEPKDLDVVVEMKDGAKKITAYLKKEFGDAISTPVQLGAYPIWQITFKKDITYADKVFKTKGAVLEFADTMTEKFPDDNSRQREVEYAPLKDDIERRDFTINMMLKDLTTGEIKDITGLSKKDIEKGVLRHINEDMLDKRFKEDPLRLLRLIRFSAVKNFGIPKIVLKIAKKNAERIKIVSSERISGELIKTMETGKLKQAIRLMKTIGILKHILPEVDALRGVSQGDKYHLEGDVYKHTLKVLENAKPGIENQMAALLHDIGKPATQQILPDKTTFIDHQHAGAEIARAIMTRLKFTNKTRDKVVSLVKLHMDPLFKQKAKNKNLRKYIREVGDETIDAVLNLARADELGRLPAREEIPVLIKRIDEIRNSPIKMQKKSLIDGKEIIEITGLKQGPAIGKAKEFLLDLQDDYATKNKNLSKAVAVKFLREKYKK